MEKELLYKYFRAETCQEENDKIMVWIEESVENKEEFLAERRLWNISLLVGDLSTESIEEKRTSGGSFIKRYIWQFTTIAAACIAVLIGVWNYYPASEGEQMVMVPVGQRVNLILADGTSVWLNSNTTFNYPLRFDKKKREVRINGEGYFDVARNEDAPFIVNTEKYQVEVLGTVFNVYAYDGLDSFETALLEGSVKVKNKTDDRPEIVLQPNEKVFEKENRLYKKVGLEEDIYKWKSGIISFYDEPIKNVMEVLSAYYNTQISLECSGVSDYRCTAKFSVNDGLEYILKVLQKDLKYEIRKEANGNVVLK